MDDLRFYVLFNSIFVISGRWEGDYETLCAVDFHLSLERFPSQESVSNPGPPDQQASAKPTDLPSVLVKFLDNKGDFKWSKFRKFYDGLHQR